MHATQMQIEWIRVVCEIQSHYQFLGANSEFVKARTLAIGLLLVSATTTELLRPLTHQETPLGRFLLDNKRSELEWRSTVGSGPS